MDSSHNQKFLLAMKKLRAQVLPHMNADRILILKLYILELGENVCCLRHLVSVPSILQACYLTVPQNSGVSEGNCRQLDEM